MKKPTIQKRITEAANRLPSSMPNVRLEKSITQEALADLVGLDRSYMGGVERGEHNLALINIKRIADGLGLSIAQLMEKANL